MSKKEKVSVSELFSRLELFSSKEEHEGVLDCSQRILAQTPEDFSAIKAFAVSGCPYWCPYRAEVPRDGGRRLTIGERCIVHAEVVIGADGFGFTPQSQPLARKN